MENKSIKFSLKGFLLKLLAFFVLVFIVDRAIGYLLRKYYFKQQSGYNYQSTYAIDKTEANILILGSSRAADLLNPDLFEQHFNMSCYNAGKLGYPLFYHYAVLKAALKRYVPKIVILSFDAGNFSVRVDAYDKLSGLLPYYSYHPEIRPLVELKGPYEKIKLLSDIYPYNSLLLPIISGNSEFSKIKFATIKGYAPLKNVIRGPLIKFDYTAEKELDTVKIRTYRAFIEDCLKANIKVYVICPPYMINSTGIDRSITEGKRIAQEYHVNFFDYTTDSFYLARPELFADFRHLNEKGVEIFSRSVIKNISDADL